MLTTASRHFSNFVNGQGVVDGMRVDFHGVDFGTNKALRGKQSHVVDTLSITVRESWLITV